MRDCNAVSIFGINTDKNLVMHLCPDAFGDYFFGNPSRNIKKLADKFKEAVDKLRQEGIKPEGLIFGGNYKWKEVKTSQWF